MDGLPPCGESTENVWNSQSNEPVSRDRTYQEVRDVSVIKLGELGESDTV